MASRMTKHTKTTDSEEQKKALVSVWFTSRVQMVNHLYILVAKHLRSSDFFAREASFHGSRRRQYQRDPTHWRSAK